MGGGAGSRGEKETEGEGQKRAKIRFGQPPVALGHSGLGGPGTDHDWVSDWLSKHQWAGTGSLLTIVCTFWKRA
ncbi:hypothetical protein CHU98_g9823 [Xylaria longipes]|nr:hypothetical protein CHU98_g9823 [Xylaria longipes]